MRGVAALASGWRAFSFPFLVVLSIAGGARAQTEVSTQVDVFSTSTVNNSQLAFVQKLTRTTTGTVTNRERFGAAVAVDGDTLVVGMPHGDSTGAFNYSQSTFFLGQAWLYGRKYPGNRTSEWELVQILKAPDGAAGDYFAGAVAIDGDTLVVSASFDGQGGATGDVSNAGSVYVYTRSIPGSANSLWTFSQNIRNPLRGENDHFGWSVALDGDVIIVGAPEKDVTDDGSQLDPALINLAGNEIGAVYVFARGTANDLTSAFVLIDRLEVADKIKTAEALFGRTVAISGDTIVASMSIDEYTTDTCVLGFVFTRVTPGSLHSRWEFRSSLQAAFSCLPLHQDPDDVTNHFKPVAIDGDTIVVGAPMHQVKIVDNTGVETTYEQAGKAYVWTRASAGAVNGSWSFATALTADTFRDGDSFGRAVAIDGEYVAVGNPGQDADPDSTLDDDQGTVYVFHRNSSVGNLNEFNLTARFRNSDTATNNEYFGCCVSIDGNTVVVGVDDFAPTASKKGAAFIFALPEVLVEVTDTEVTTTVLHSPPPPAPTTETSFFENMEFMLSTILGFLFAAPLTCLAICAFFFKPWLRRKLLGAGWVNLADTIVPDWKSDVRLIKVEVGKLQEYIKEHSYPRLTNVRSVIRADELKLPPVSGADVSDSYKIGKPAVGTMTTGVFQGKTVAVNSMFPGGLAIGVPSKVSGSLKKEVATLATLNHPNLRLVKGAVPEKGVVVLEHCAGGSVKEKLLDEEGGGMDAFKTTAVALGAANGLAYLEREKIVHGDVTVDSIHLDANGDAKLGDFGFQQTKKNIERETSKKSFFGFGSSKVASAKSVSAGAVVESFGVSFDEDTTDTTDSWTTFWRNSAWRGRRVAPSLGAGPGPVCEKTDKDPEEEAEKAAWMAPELLKKGKKAKKTPASDVYALGITLWQLYERRKPYGDCSAYEIKIRVLQGERPEFRSSSVPFKIKGIVECCLKEKAKARPAATEVSFMIQEAAKEMKQPTRVLDKGVVKHEKKFQS